MNYLELVGLVFKILFMVVFSLIGSIIGAMMGAIIVPMKILDGRALSSLGNIKDVILPNNDPNKDRI